MFNPLAVTPAVQPPVFHDITVQGFGDNYCVYEVWSAGSLIYIGVCKFTLFPTLPDAQNNSEFVRMVDRMSTAITVRIVATGTRPECFAYRVRMIRGGEAIPPCNARGVIGRHTAVQCVEDGKVYRTQSAAAAAYGVTQTVISNHLRGVNGYGAIAGGRTFRRVAI